jgi:hypothetical protein
VVNPRPDEPGAEKKSLPAAVSVLPRQQTLTLKANFKIGFEKNSATKGWRVGTLARCASELAWAILAMNMGAILESSLRRNRRPVLCYRIGNQQGYSLIARASMSFFAPLENAPQMGVTRFSGGDGGN